MRPHLREPGGYSEGASQALTLTWLTAVGAELSSPQGQDMARPGQPQGAGCTQVPPVNTQPALPTQPSRHGLWQVRGTSLCGQLAP